MRYACFVYATGGQRMGLDQAHDGPPGLAETAKQVPPPWSLSPICRSPKILIRGSLYLR